MGKQRTENSVTRTLSAFNRHTPHRRKNPWHRTRSNPVSRRGGQRARDNPEKKPERANANEANFIKTNIIP
nr:MAG TPA: hypothetical protein [Caudoviricetes sp.]